MRCQVITVLAAAVFAACAPAPEAVPAPLEAFDAAFRAAHQADQVDALRALFYAPETDPSTERQLRFALESELGLPIQRIAYTPIQNRHQAKTAAREGTDGYRLSLAPVYAMRVVYDTGDRYTLDYQIGPNPDGNWSIAVQIPVE